MLLVFVILDALKIWFDDAENQDAISFVEDIDGLKDGCYTRFIFCQRKLPLLAFRSILRVFLGQPP
jgi:hypothetical protein